MKLSRTFHSYQINDSSLPQEGFFITLECVRRFWLRFSALNYLNYNLKSKWTPTAPWHCVYIAFFAVNCLRKTLHLIHSVKCVRIRTFSGPYSVRMRENEDQKTPNTDTFHAVICLTGFWLHLCFHIREKQSTLFLFSVFKSL